MPLETGSPAHAQLSSLGNERLGSLKYQKQPKYFK